ncbi:MAG: 3-hydroxybutyryl-CoA dehydrogenase [Myxococcales bacterium]
MEIRKVCVVGGGAMGRQIALNTALHGCETVLTDVNGKVLAEGRDFNERWLSERVGKGKLPEERAAQARKLLRYEADVDAAAQACDLAVEAIVEDLGIKRKVFERLDRACPPGAILATNSSTIVSSKIATATQRPAQVANLHYFNPALVMELVEVVQGPHTSAGTAQALMDFCTRTGKTPILLRKEIYGFVANRLLHAIRREALHLLDQGVATVEEIDLAAEKALKHPMGPFRLQDFTGLDISYGASMSRFNESGDPADRPHPLIEEKVKKGELGRKTGKGWYAYPEGKPR